MFLNKNKITSKYPSLLKIKIFGLLSKIIITLIESKKWAITIVYWIVVNDKILSEQILFIYKRNYNIILQSFQQYIC
mgnify:CR=1 FL=1|jgi:hypothetical protein